MTHKQITNRIYKLTLRLAQAELYIVSLYKQNASPRLIKIVDRHIVRLEKRLTRTERQLAKHLGFICPTSESEERGHNA